MSSQTYHISPKFSAYVDTNMVGSGKIARAAILGRLGGVWAASPGFTVYCLSIAATSSFLTRSSQLSQAEQDALVKAFDNAVETQANGIRLMGQKYFTISVGESIIQGKKSVCSLLENPSRAFH